MIAPCTGTIVNVECAVSTMRKQNTRCHRGDAAAAQAPRWSELARARWVYAWGEASARTSLAPQCAAEFLHTPAVQQSSVTAMSPSVPDLGNFSKHGITRTCHNPPLRRLWRRNRTSQPAAHARETPRSATSPGGWAALHHEGGGARGLHPAVAGEHVPGHRAFFAARPTRPSARPPGGSSGECPGALRSRARRAMRASETGPRPPLCAPGVARRGVGRAHFRPESPIGRALTFARLSTAASSTAPTSARYANAAAGAGAFTDVGGESC